MTSFRWTQAVALTILLLGPASSCALFRPPPPPPLELLGCLRISGEVLRHASDTLGYEVPSVVKLTDHLAGLGKEESWSVLPFADHKPYWTRRDWLPSGYIYRQEHWRALPEIPGDSFDIYFPGRMGDVVVRLGSQGVGYGGRAEWVDFSAGGEYRLWVGSRVEAVPTSCSDLKVGLRYIRR